MQAVSLADVDINRPRQVIIGWLRNAFEQSRAVATLTRDDMAHAAAPNRRSFAETVVQLHWLYSVPRQDRPGVIDVMIEDDRKHTRKATKHLSEMGYDSTVDFSDMEALVVEMTKSTDLKQQATAFVDAAKATQGQAMSFYYAWREETPYAHATAKLAASYAPDCDDKIGQGRPPSIDPELEAHRLGTMLIVVLAYRLLLEEGVPEEVAKGVIDTYFNVQ